MKGTPAVYLGRIVEKDNFRTFIFDPNGAKKLIESWDAFEAAMQSGLWFATKEDAESSKYIPEEPQVDKVHLKPKRPSREKPKLKAKEQVVKDEEPSNVLEDDGSVIEVKYDEF